MSQDKSFEPTKKKLDKAKKEGKVPYSKEITIFMQLSACILMLKYIQFNWHVIIDLYHKIFIYGEQNYVEINSYVWLYILRMSTLCLCLSLLVLGIVTVSAEYAQKSFILSFAKIKPSLDNVNPLTGFKRLFHVQSSEGIDIRNFLEEIVIVSSLCIGVGVVLGSLIYDYFVIIIKADIDNVSVLTLIFSEIIHKIILKIMLICFLLSIIKYVKSRREILKELKMTLDEYRKELKEDEGDPHAKTERKAIHREISLNNILESVKKASIVITD